MEAQIYTKTESEESTVDRFAYYLQYIDILCAHMDSFIHVS